MKTIETDIVIIGSGVGGSICGYELAKNGLKVIIVEAGKHFDRQEIVNNFTGTDKLDNSAGFPNSKFAPRPDWGDDNDSYIKQVGPEKAKIEYLRGVGGTTWHWGGACMRFSPEDFKIKTNYGVGRDWPIDYKTIEPYYTKAENEIGVAGDHKQETGAPKLEPYPFPALTKSYADKKIEDGLKKIGISFITKPIAINSSNEGDRPKCAGFGTCTPICPSGAMYNGSIHAKKAVDNGATLLDNTRVDRLESDENGKIISAIAKTTNGTKLKIKGKYFVIAANGIESAKLLLMSKNKNYPNGLANSSGMVGRNFFDHPGIDVVIKMPENIFSGRGPNNKITSYKFRHGDTRRDYASWILSVENKLNIHNIANEALNSKVNTKDLNDKLRDNIKKQVTLTALAEQLPDYKNGIELDWEDLDSTGNPKMKLYYSFSNYETKSFEKIRENITKATEALGAKIINFGKPHSHHHLMGMTIMGNNPNNSVVDKNCKTHDHTNLYISSSSTFPSGSVASPTLTIAALALMVAKNIQNEIN